MDEIARFFDLLREIRKPEAKMRVLESKTDAAVRKALDKHVAWSFNETPLSRAVVKIAADLGVHVVIDQRALDDMGLDPDTTRLSLPFLYFDAREALRRALTPQELSFAIENGTLVITTRETAESRLQTAIYNITDLLATGKATEDGLVEAIYETIQPTTWDEVGGPGSSVILHLPGGHAVLIVSQTEDVLHEIGPRLDGLRNP